MAGTVSCEAREDADDIPWFPLYWAWLAMMDLVTSVPALELVQNQGDSCWAAQLRKDNRIWRSLCCLPCLLSWARYTLRPTFPSLLPSNHPALQWHVHLVLMPSANCASLSASVAVSPSVLEYLMALLWWPALVVRLKLQSTSQNWAS